MHFFESSWISTGANMTVLLLNSFFVWNLTICLQYLRLFEANSTEKNVKQNQLGLISIQGLIEEDDYLHELVGEGKSQHWSEIEKKFNSKFGGREKTCKQLRQRFKNYLQYEKGNSLVKVWSKEQEKLLFQEYLEKGSKWTNISKNIPGKCEAYIKNKFYGGLRKALRRINEIRRAQVTKFSKPIKYSSLVRVLEIKENSSTLPEALQKDALELREQIINFCQRQLNLEHSEEVLQFCQLLFKFNFSSRCYRIKKLPSKKVKRHTSRNQPNTFISDQDDDEEQEFSEIPVKVEEKQMKPTLSDTAAMEAKLEERVQKLPFHYSQKQSAFMIKQAKENVEVESQKLYSPLPIINPIVLSLFGQHFGYFPSFPFTSSSISGSDGNQQKLSE